MPTGLTTGPWHKGLYNPSGGKDLRSLNHHLSTLTFSGLSVEALA